MHWVKIFSILRFRMRTVQSLKRVKAITGQKQGNHTIRTVFTVLTVMKKTVWIMWFPCFWPVIALTRFRLCTVKLFKTHEHQKKLFKLMTLNEFPIKLHFFNDDFDKFIENPCNSIENSFIVINRSLFLGEVKIN